MIDNILEDNSVVTDIAGDYTLVKTKNPTIAFQLVKLGFKLNEHDSFEKNNLDQEDRLKTIKNLISINSIFSAGRDWSPEELLDFYREQKLLNEPYRVISWTDRNNYQIRIVE